MRRVKRGAVEPTGFECLEHLPTEAPNHGEGGAYLHVPLRLTAASFVLTAPKEALLDGRGWVEGAGLCRKVRRVEVLVHDGDVWIRRRERRFPRAPAPFIEL